MKFITFETANPIKHLLCVRYTVCHHQILMMMMIMVVMVMMMMVMLFGGEKLMTNKFTIYSMTFTLIYTANFRFFQI